MTSEHKKCSIRVNEYWGEKKWVPRPICLMESNLFVWFSGEGGAERSKCPQSPRSKGSRRAGPRGMQNSESLEGMGLKELLSLRGKGSMENVRPCGCWSLGVKIEDRPADTAHPSDPGFTQDRLGTWGTKTGLCSCTCSIAVVWLQSWWLT